MKMEMEEKAHPKVWDEMEFYPPLVENPSSNTLLK
jgi:hypothetical protein